MTICSPTEDSWQPLYLTHATRMSKPRSLKAWLVQLPIWSTMVGRTLTTMPSSTTWRRRPNSRYFWSQYRHANKGTITSLLPTTSSASFVNIHPQYLLVRLPTTPSTNKKAWGLLQITFPSRYFLGCYSHGLHLFVKDMFAVTKTKKSRPSRGHLSRPIPIRAHAGIYCLLQGCRQVLSQPSHRQGSPTRSAALCRCLNARTSRSDSLGNNSSHVLDLIGVRTALACHRHRLRLCARYICPEKWEIKDDALLNSLLDPLEGLSMLNCGKLELGAAPDFQH